MHITFWNVKKIKTYSLVYHFRYMHIYNTFKKPWLLIYIPRKLFLWSTLYNYKKGIRSMFETVQPPYHIHTAVSYFLRTIEKTQYDVYNPHTN